MNASPETAGVTFAITVSRRMDLDAFARAAGLHPELVRRLVALGVLEAASDADGRLWFQPSQLNTAARVQRLRSDLGVNYAALGLVVDLLDRIEQLEAALRSASRHGGGRRWT